jgi:hypothetical protein
MNLSKACKLALLASFSCLLLMVFSGAAYSATVHWTVTGNATEVITTGRSEVAGSVTLIVDDPALAFPGASVLSGTPAGGVTQLGITYGLNSNSNFPIQIDNQPDSGIRVYGPAFASAGLPLGLIVQNITSLSPTGQCSGFITIIIQPGVPLKNGDTIKVDGVRLRVDVSQANTVNTDIWVQVQSINDPTGNTFSPDTVRVAKSWPPLLVSTAVDVAYLCYRNWGNPSGPDAFLAQKITITEGFTRAFVAKDSNGAGVDSTDRVDNGGPNSLGGPFPGNLANFLGLPLNGTQVKVYLSGIPASIESVSWPSQAFNVIVPPSGPPAGFSWFQFIAGSSSFTAGTPGDPTKPGSASATYEYVTNNQTGLSDSTTESFVFNPQLKLSATNQQDTGTVLAGVSLWPPATDNVSSGCVAPYFAADYAALKIGRPRFATLYYSTSPNGNPVTGNPDATTKQLTGGLTGFGIYETFAPCRCYLLFPYVSVTSYYDTGLTVANTSMDSQVFGALGAPIQGGTVTWWLYDSLLKSLNTTGINLPATTPGQGGYSVDLTGTPVYQAGQTFQALASQILALVTPAKTQFTGYMIARANFQYCHGIADITDKTFANAAMGYVASVIPDPAVKGPYRTASAAADVITKLLAGESLNN